MLAYYASSNSSDDTFFTLVVLIAVGCAIAGLAIGTPKGQPWTCAILGGLLGPIGLIIAWTMAPTAHVQQARADAQWQTATWGKKLCPACAEWVQQQAVICRYCGIDLPPAEPEPEFPIADYDTLTENQIVPLIPKLTPAENTVVTDYERAHQGRPRIMASLARNRTQ